MIDDGMVYIAIALLAIRAEAKSTWDSIVLMSIAVIFLIGGLIDLVGEWVS